MESLANCIKAQIISDQQLRYQSRQPFLLLQRKINLLHIKTTQHHRIHLTTNHIKMHYYRQSYYLNYHLAQDKKGKQITKPQIN